MIMAFIVDGVISFFTKRFRGWSIAQTHHQMWASTHVSIVDFGGVAFSLSIFFRVFGLLAFLFTVVTVVKWGKGYEPPGKLGIHGASIPLNYLYQYQYLAADQAKTCWKLYLHDLARSHGHCSASAMLSNTRTLAGADGSALLIIK